MNGLRNKVRKRFRGEHNYPICLSSRAAQTERDLTTAKRVTPVLCGALANVRSLTFVRDDYDLLLSTPRKLVAR